MIWVQPSRFGAPGGGGGPTLVAGLHEGLGGGGGTTSDLDTTGANLIVITINTYSVPSSGPSDSKSNTWTELTMASDGGFHRVRVYYCYNPTVGSGHNFSTSLGYSGMGVMAFSGIASSPFDQESGASASSTTTVQPGSITPSQANTVQIFAWEHDNQVVTPSVNSGFTINGSVTPSGGNYTGGGSAYRIATSASAVNPTLTLSGTSNVLVCHLSVFKY